MRSARRPVAALLALAALVAPAAGQEAAPRVVDLDEAVALALERNPVAVGARSAVTTAAADVLAARGAWLPSLSAGSSFSNSSNERFDQSTGRLVSESYNAQLQAGYDLFTGGRRLAEQRSAASGLRAAEANERARTYETVLTTTRTFYAAAAAGEIVRAAEQRLARARQQQEFADTRLRLGTATRSDQLRAELETGNAELALIEAAAERRSTRLELGRQVGVAGPAEPETGVLPEAVPPLPPLAVLIAWAAARSPEVEAADAALDRARAERWFGYGRYLPTLRATAGYDWFAFDFPPDDRSWSLRLSATWPLFDNFDREAQVARAAAAARLAEAEARDAEIAVRVAVEDAVAALEAADQRVAITRRAVELSREDLRVQEERYRIGSATILDLQASQLALSEAETEAIRARQEIGVETAELEAVLGARLADMPAGGTE